MMITCQFDASTLLGSNGCSRHGLDITEKLSNGRSGFHENLVELRLRSFSVVLFSPSAKAAQIRIPKQNLEVEQLTVVAAVRLRVASFLLKSSRRCLRFSGSVLTNQTADRCFHVY